MSSAIVASSEFLRQRSLISTGETCQILGISLPTLDQLVRDQKLEVVRMGPNSWRRITCESVMKLLGEQSPSTMKDDGGSGRVAIYARRSDSTELGRKALAEQVSEMKEFVLKEFHDDEPLVFAETCSGISVDLKSRVQLGKLLDAVSERKIKTLVVKDSSRLSRGFGNSKLLLWIMQLFNVAVHFVHQQIDEDEAEVRFNVEELISVMTCWTAKISGAKGGRKVRKHFEPEAQKIILSMNRNGSTTRAIMNHLSDRGIAPLGDDGTRRKLTMSSINIFLRKSNRMTYTTNTKVVKSEQEVRDFIITQWIAENLEATTSKRGTKTAAELFHLYEDWCRANKYAPTNRRFFYWGIQKKFPECRRLRFRNTGDGINARGTYYYTGIQLRDRRKNRK